MEANTLDCIKMEKEMDKDLGLEKINLMKKEYGKMVC